ncbi:MAG: hypothetical protein E6Q56_07510 [Mycobacterium sp.]|nr:MAG: hypothetical protein E6Q56_07510 [Mycobacterium sp.]
MTCASGMVPPFSLQHALNDRGLTRIESATRGRDQRLDVQPVSTYKVVLVPDVWPPASRRD